MIPKRFEQEALELVIEAANHGGLWTRISPDTVEIVIRAVALDLERAARIAEASDASEPVDNHSDPEHT